jgi:hypothetical protein
MVNRVDPKLTSMQIGERERKKPASLIEAVAGASLATR